MKLRFRNNSLRLRVNQREVAGLAAGAVLKEEIVFPGEARMAYVLEPSQNSLPEASFEHGVIRVAAPQTQFREWANSDSVGIYFDLPANGASLRVAIEKDLECVEASPEERDPDAFPRGIRKNCST
jgi:hypothetical protein